MHWIYVIYFLHVDPTTIWNSNITRVILLHKAHAEDNFSY